MEQRNFLRLLVASIIMISLCRVSLADSDSLNTPPASSSCSGGPDCIILAGIMLMMSGVDLKPATAEKMDSVPGSLVIFCQQEGAVPEMNFPCGPTEVDVIDSVQKQSLNFRGGKIVLPQLEEENKPTVLIRARGCKETQTIRDAKPGDVVRIQLSAACSK